MRHELLVALVLLGVVAVGAILLWAIRSRADDWARRYDEAAAEEGATGASDKYPAVGRYARRLSSRFVAVVLVLVVVLLVILMAFPASAS